MNRRSVFIAVLLVALAAVDGRSFWIDEAGTAMILGPKASTTLAERLLADAGSTAQMPLHALYGWAWQCVSGPVEYGLRLSNLPWFAVGVLALVAWSPVRLRRFLLPVVLLSPFLWYYLNEYRSYVMLWAGACLALGPVALASREEAQEALRRAGPALAVAAGFLVLAGSSLLGAAWCGAALVAWWVHLPLRWYRSLPRCAWGIASGLAVLLGVLAVYYGGLLLRGTRAASIETQGWKEGLFAFYELTGLAGLGPGRLALRATGGAALAQAQYVVPILLALASLGVVGVAALGAAKRQGWRRLMVWTILVAPVPALVAAGPVLHFRVLGRHLTPALVPLLAILATGFCSLWERGGLRRSLVVFAAAWLLLSCLQVRFAPRHGKDDYRGAARSAREALAAGRTVWWSASAYGAEFYGLSMFTPTDKAPHLVPVVGRTDEEMALLPQPQWVVQSKPDLFDSQGALERYLRQHGWVRVRDLMAFGLWAPAGATGQEELP